MAVQTRTIKRRIKSVTNTRKITKAMELVSASKMRKAVNSVLMSKPYARLAWEAVGSIATKIDTSLHPLLRQTDHVKTVLVLLLSSDRGLAGGYNWNIIKMAMQKMRQLGDGMSIQTICIGKRGADAMRRAQQPILASFTEMTNNTKFEDLLPISRMVIEEFSKGTYDKVLVVYTDFVSAITQKPMVIELLPLGTPESLKSLGEVGHEQAEKQAKAGEYLFEPSPTEVLNKILPRLVETMVYQAVLEAAASEHSARMMAMRNASDSAAEMLDDLTFTFNQARQAGITQEIAEISSGKAALEKY